MKIKKTLAVSLLAIFTASLAMVLSKDTTSSYYSSQDSITNELSVGTCEIEIVEEFNPPEEITVGDTVFTKTVQIKNTGTIPSYIRVFCDYSTYDMKKYCSVNTGSEWVAASDLKDHLPSGWVYIEDTDETLGNYYYYTEALEPNELTVPLFTEVKVSVPDTDEDLITPFDIIVYSEAVQIRDKNGKLFTSAEPWKEAWTEFLTTGGE